MQAHVSNLFADIVVAPPGSEEIVTLLETEQARIERIVSSSHPSPDGFWYDQPEDEWVLVLEGEATLEFDPGEARKMRVGDHVFIPRRTRHRVKETSLRTVWLAIHLKAVT